MLSRRIRVVLAALLMAGCTFLFGAIGGADAGPSPCVQTAKPKVNVVVITPGAAQKRTAAERSQQSAEGSPSGARPLPNYREETLTLGLLEK